MSYVSEKAMSTGVSHLEFKAEQLPSGLHTFSAPEQGSVSEFCEPGYSWIDSLAEMQ